MNLIPTFFKQLKRDFLIQLRQPHLLINGCLFYIMIIVFFPLTLPINQQLIQQVLPGIVWTAALLAMLLTAERLFQQDYEEGLVEQWLISGQAVSLIIAAKLLVHWLMIIVPILLLCPVLALLFDLSGWPLLILMISLLAGSPALIGLCALAAAFSIGLQQKGIFMALILFPLTIPIMIFGSAALTAAVNANAVGGYLALLTAISLIASAFLPIAAAAIIRISLAD